MKSNLWGTADNRNNKDVSRDFIHLSQAIHTPGKNRDFKHQIAVILENCMEDEDYKSTAIKNLAILAAEYEQIKQDLEYFAYNKNPYYRNIQHLAAEIRKEEALFGCVDAKL